MKNSAFYNRYVLVIGFLFAFCNTVESHESNRSNRLKQTNDELVTRLAEVLAENEVLRKRLDRLNSAERKVNRGKIGCQPESIFDQFMQYSRTKRDDFLVPWLKKNGFNCTSGELNYISTIMLPEMAFTNPAKTILRKITKKH